MSPTLGDRTFQLAALSLWNALPPAIPDVKTLDAMKIVLKTRFFN